MDTEKRRKIRNSSEASVDDEIAVTTLVQLGDRRNLNLKLGVFGVLGQELPAEEMDTWHQDAISTSNN